MSGCSVACGVFVVLTPTKCNHCALRAFLQVDGRKNQQGFEEQDQEAHVPEAPPLPVSPQIFRQESSAEAGCKVTKKTKGTAKAVARIVDEKKRFKIKWRGYQVSEIAAKCLQLARQGRRKKAVEKLKERLKAS
ncbi:unnamed protein product [Effrenium voratum]|uniref:Uncharacterized protein n=1 Tax=Effrenium voratum TaxID=2562239 RepID=A0AA36IHD7_9DINO|nr:unnamed protein product [Effrenium voratum]